jgi:hypothetical protein
VKDINSIIKAYEAKGREMANLVFGSSVNLSDLSTAFQNLLPESARELQELCKFYEAEMLRCRDSGAYFSGCLAGAAMTESFLLLLCFLEKTTVEKTKGFQSSKKKGKNYDQVIVHWTLKELIPLTEELDWITPAVVDRELVKALIDGYREILPMVKPDIKDEDVQAVLSLIEKRPNAAMLHLMQSMRNLVHGGRCVRLRKQLWSDDFSDWAKLVMVLTVEIRDCLILRLQDAFKRHLTTLADSPEGLTALTNLFMRFSRVSQDSQ